MPELAEVEVGRRLAEKVAVGKTVVEARCAPDPIVFEQVSPDRIEAELRGRAVHAARRHGKHVFLELGAKATDGEPLALLFHFGMTGALRAPQAEPVPLESGIRDEPGTWPPRFTKLELRLSDGGKLAFTNARRLGRVRIRGGDPMSEPPLRDLGFDPLTALAPLDDFLFALSRRSAPVKAVLLDQRFAAGIGNWLADEILFQAGIDPRRRAKDLGKPEVERLRSAMEQVVGTAVRAEADKRRFPADWLFHHRWGRGKSAAETPLELAFETIAGRTTAWVPARQR